MADIKTSVEAKVGDMEKEEGITISEAPVKDIENLNSSKESDCENVDAIKKFIESQEKEISDAKLKTQNEKEKKIEELTEEKPKTPDPEIENITEPVEAKMYAEENEKVNIEVDEVPQNETLAVASSVIDMILDNSEAKLAENDKKENRNIFPKESPSASVKGNNSVALSIGSKVEAKDFGEYWHPAEIIEVDFDEMEVLVHYEDANKKHDEWISVSSPRLRPKGSGSPAVPPPSEGAAPSTSAADVPSASTQIVNEEVKVEEKPKNTFTVGERCLARWRDNRRFIATVNADLGDGKYEVVFDDGTKWTCSVTRLSKVKESVKDPLVIDTSGVSASPSTPSPVYGPGPSNAGVLPTPVPAYNTHLFDPARDYLGSKSERRLMKRKLNIKEIFNIGQKKKKTDTTKVAKAPTPKVEKEKAPTPKVEKEKAPTPKVEKEKAPTPKVEKEKAPTPKVEKEKAPTPKVERDKKPKVKKVKMEPREVLPQIKKEIPDAVASIIGTVSKDSPQPEEEEVKDEIKIETEETEVTVVSLDAKMDIDDGVSNSETLSSVESQVKQGEEQETVVEEEDKLEKFEKDEGDKHEKVLDRIKEAIIKLEVGLKQPEVKLEKLDISKDVVQEPKTEETVSSDVTTPPKAEKKKSLSKIKKVKKVRLLQEKKVKRQVEKVKSELEEMKRQMEEMRKKMSEELSKTKQVQEMPESFLLPGEWCCKWVNGQPLGTVSEIEHEGKGDGAKPVLPRRSVQVDDKRLPPGWTKHMVRRSFGTSAGKWDVVLMTPDHRRIHTKTDMKHYLENNPDKALQNYIPALMDFGVHLKLSRRMGWYTTTPDGETQLPVNTLSANSPLLVRKKKLSLKKNKLKDGKRNKIRIKLKVPKGYQYEPYPVGTAVPGTSGDVPGDDIFASGDAPPENMPLEDGFVYVGSLKVQIIENLLRCPAEGCFKNFRNNTLLKMHIKHYHRELRKMLGATPKVLDLAYARTRPTQMGMRGLKREAQQKAIRVKIPKPQKKIAEPKIEKKETTIEPKTETPLTPVKSEGEKIPRALDSPKLRHALINKPLKRPKVLLPVRRSETMDLPSDMKSEDDTDDSTIQPKIEVPLITEPLDFETAISTHTVTKPISDKKNKKKKTFASIQKRPLTASEDEDWLGVNSDMDTRSSYPRSGTPDSKVDQKLISSESNEEHKDGNYLYNENGERIKIVHMKREEIINCHCGFREEDGLMVQCELCLCWQHGLCHNIQKESDVPEKYTCSICLNPRRGRRSQRFLHDQDRLYEGLLPGAKPCESLRRSHELSGNLHRIEDALHALRVKYHVATKKDHPKLYLWANDWETGDLSLMQEKLNSDYSDLNIMISNIGKENLPVKPEDMKDIPLDIRTPPSEDTEADRFSQKDNQLGSQALLSGLLSSPAGVSLDLPISTSELERLAKTVQAEQEAQRVIVPQPEAAIENSACRQHLLRHIQRCQALIDARLDSIEAQVAELESQDPSFEDDETADYFPRTKQTIQMLMRDLDTMDELGVIT